MPDSFDLIIPTVDGCLEHTLNKGEILFFLGANGSGKSALVSHLFKAHHQVAKRISAHRQTWFHSNTLDLTPNRRVNLENNIRSQDRQESSRWREEYASERAGAAIFDLIDADNMQARSIADLVRSGNLAEAQGEANSPSPIQVVNELLKLSNLPIEINVEEGQKIVARRSSSAPYSVAELSDGERSAFLIAANILTAKAGTLLLVDEPERHLHRSIISPLLSLLFQERKDCAFIVSTHEVMLPVDNPTARTLLVRSCDYENSRPKYWTADLLSPEAQIDDELKRDILGSRRKIVFVEGNAQSLDVPLYNLLFPQVSVKPKSSCRDVENAVRGLSGVAEMHWLSVWGIVDNDRRTKEDIERLRNLGVYALSYFSVESIYYHPEMILRIARRQANITGDNPSELHKHAIAKAVQAARAQKTHLVLKVVERLARQHIFSQLPTQEDIQNNHPVKIQVDVTMLRACIEKEFISLVAGENLGELLKRYQLRESGALNQIAKAVGFSTRTKYEAAVHKLLQDDAEALAYFRGFFAEMYDKVDSE